METNEIWIQGFSNSIEEIAKRAFIAGFFEGNNQYTINKDIAEAEFEEWLKQRQE